MFAKLIQELQMSGLTEKEIAEAVGTSQPTISRLKRGTIKEPRFEVGLALVSLRKKNPPVHRTEGFS